MGSSTQVLNMKFVVLFGLVGACTAGGIFEYKDPEKGISHVQSGVPGEQVVGMYEFTDPEGKEYNVAYAAGEQGYVASASHLPKHPEETEEVAAARSVFMDKFMMAEEMAAEMAAENAAEFAGDVVVESLRRRRSPVTNPLGVVPSMPAYTYTYANPVTYSVPLTYHTYPATYAVQYPYFHYPAMKQSENTESMMEESEESQEMGEAALLQPSLPLSHPVIRIGFQGLQPVQLETVGSQPVQVQPVQQTEESNERILQQGDDEPAALAL